MGQPSVTDIVGLFVFVAALLFSREVAQVVGPYMVIVAAASIGASFSLARREKDTRVRAVWFFVRVCGLALLITVSLAAIVAAYHPDLSERALVAPIALLVGYIGDDWPRLLAKVVKAIMAGVDLLRTRGGGHG